MTDYIAWINKGFVWAVVIPNHLNNSDTQQVRKNHQATLEVLQGSTF